MVEQIVTSDGNEPTEEGDSSRQVDAQTQIDISEYGEYGEYDPLSDGASESDSEHASGLEQGEEEAVSDSGEDDTAPEPEVPHPLNALDPLEDLDPRKRDKSDFIPLNVKRKSEEESYAQFVVPTTKPLNEAGIGKADYIDIAFDAVGGSVFEGVRPFYTLVEISEDEADVAPHARKIMGQPGSLNHHVPASLVHDPKHGLGIDAESYSNEDRILLYPKVLDDGLIILYVAYPESIYEELREALTSPVGEEIDMVIDNTIYLGYYTASHLLDVFGSIENIVNAPDTELLGIKGIDRDIVDDLRAGLDPLIERSTSDNQDVEANLGDGGTDEGETADTSNSDGEPGTENEEPTVPRIEGVDRAAIEDGGLLFGVEPETVATTIRDISNLDTNELVEDAVATFEDPATDRTAYVLEKPAWEQFVDEQDFDGSVANAVQAAYEEVAREIITAADPDLDYQFEFAGSNAMLVVR